jgi:hypothetical protein
MELELDSVKEKRYNRIRNLLKKEGVIEAKMLFKNGTTLNFKDYTKEIDL